MNAFQVPLGCLNKKILRQLFMVYMFPMQDQDWLLQLYHKGNLLLIRDAYIKHVSINFFFSLPFMFACMFFFTYCLHVLYLCILVSLPFFTLFFFPHIIRLFQVPQQLYWVSFVLLLEHILQCQKLWRITEIFKWFNMSIILVDTLSLWYVRSLCIATDIYVTDYSQDLDLLYAETNYLFIGSL